jgi:hypothetical protein
MQNLNDDCVEVVNWVPMGDCIATWKKQPAPIDPKRPELDGRLWVPPSEDPWYQAKWARIKAGAVS